MREICPTVQERKPLNDRADGSERNKPNKGDDLLPMKKHSAIRPDQVLDARIRAFASIDRLSQQSFSKEPLQRLSKNISTRSLHRTSALHVTLQNFASLDGQAFGIVSFTSIASQPYHQHVGLNPCQVGLSSPTNIIEFESIVFLLAHPSADHV